MKLIIENNENLETLGIVQTNEIIVIEDLNVEDPELIALDNLFAWLDNPDQNQDEPVGGLAELFAMANQPIIHHPVDHGDFADFADLF